VGRLIFSCPNTYRVIETGIETDDGTQSKLRPYVLSVACPHCQSTHDLQIKDGHLFKMQPRQTQIHFEGLLPDEIDVGAFINRSITKTARA
jgi:hypothetical protein